MQKFNNAVAKWRKIVYTNTSKSVLADGLRTKDAFIKEQ